MIVYVDSSALLKRVFNEAESDALESALADHVEAGDTLAVSALAWVEVERAVRTALSADEASSPGDTAAAALAGVAEAPLGPDVVSLARRTAPAVLRSLDALHLATAILLDADLMLTYDDRLSAAARYNGLDVGSPGRARGDEDESAEV